VKYASSYANQWRLPENEEYFWMILSSQVPTLIATIISLMKWRHLRRVSQENDEKKQLRISLQEVKCFLHELRGTSAFMRKLEGRRANSNMSWIH
jgi:hypothetical protein